ncbi:hypothetical protein BREVNS_0675 [Brevinematales bacterium NS]|nr:hypothetical protein BREVNS_0675 [Brevinematales bacterium NS]
MESTGLREVGRFFVCMDEENFCEVIDRNGFLVYDIGNLSVKGGFR